MTRWILGVVLLCSAVAWAGLYIDVPLYSGFTWKAAHNVQKQGAEAILLETHHCKGHQGNKALDYYTAELKKKGWQVEGPAGGGGSWVLSGKRSQEGCQVYFTAGTTFATDSRPDPKGERMKVLYWRVRPANALSPAF